LTFIFPQKSFFFLSFFESAFCSLTIERRRGTFEIGQVCLSSAALLLQGEIKYDPGQDLGLTIVRS
jgi:hypothetical protein